MEASKSDCNVYSKPIKTSGSLLAAISLIYSSHQQLPVVFCILTAHKTGLTIRFCPYQVAANDSKDNLIPLYLYFNYCTLLSSNFKKIGPESV